MKSYTHIAEIYGVKCYFNENTGDIEGTNWLNNKVIECLSWIDVTFSYSEAFEIKIIEKL